MQAAQNLMKLAVALADSFTVYLPDRRGRGLSGPPGSHYSLTAECEDIDALAQATGARNIFGLSSGAIIALQAALVLPAIGKAALYEPPLSVSGSTPTRWVARYDREVAQGALARPPSPRPGEPRQRRRRLRFVPRIAMALPLNAALRPGRARADGPGSPSGGSPARRAALLVLGWPLRKAAQRSQAPGGAAGGTTSRCGHWSQPCTTTCSWSWRPKEPCAPSPARRQKSCCWAAAKTRPTSRPPSTPWPASCPGQNGSNSLTAATWHPTTAASQHAWPTNSGPSSQAEHA